MFEAIDEAMEKVRARVLESCLTDGFVYSTGSRYL